MLSRAINILLLCLFPFFVQAQPEQSTKVETELATGLDIWSVNGTGVRYLANYSPKEPYSNVAAWSEGKLGLTFNDYMKLTLVGRTHQVDGNKVTRVELDYKIHENSAISIGILPYRITWCAPNYNNSKFIKESDPFCSFSGLNEVSDSAAGMRFINTTRIGSWVVDSQVGYWKPTIDKMDTRLAIYVPVGETTHHTKYGFSVNGMDLKTSTQFRVGSLWAEQDQLSKGSYERKLRYNMLFAGVEKNITDEIVLKTTFSSYPGKQINPAYPFEFLPNSFSTELNYNFKNNDVLSLGYTNYQNTTTYIDKPQKQLLKVNILALAYRKDFPLQKVFIIAQYNYNTSYSKSTSGTEVDLNGSQFGVRIGKHF